MKKYLVIGNPIEHSLSPVIHNYWLKKHQLFNAIYEKKKLEKKKLKSIVDEIRKNNIEGVNVTVPFKQEIIPFLDKMDHIAKNTNSVNTLYKTNNEVWGYNTDSPGFDKSLIKIDCQKKKIFIIGAGGVTSSIIYSFINKANKIYITNRTKEKAKELKRLFINNDKEIEIIDWGKKPELCDIVVNTTSVGLKKKEILDLNFDEYKNNSNTLFYDLIYNPKETNFLKEARLRGNKTMNGKMMFLWQAQISFKIWTGVNAEINEEVIKLLL